MKNKFIIKKFKSNSRYSLVVLDNDKELILRPFIYLKNGDELEFIPSLQDYREINKIFIDKFTNHKKKVKVCPPYERKEFIYIYPHKFELIFRERKNQEDWNKVKELERFHYRGKGLEKIVGRRTVLIAEMKHFGIAGFGVLSSSVAVAGPRFKLLETNFKEQMTTGLINRIVRIPRIVIHPELRGMHLGVLIAKHMVNFTKQYWDINHYSPIMIEVIAAMTEYHKFFEKAGFIKIGYTKGYKGKAIIPKYGNGSFAQRDPSEYNFMINQSRKPYFIYPLNTEIRKKIGINKNFYSINIIQKNTKIKTPLEFKDLSLQYKIKNGSTARTNIIKEVFGVDSEQAFSQVIRNFSLKIEPGDVVMFTGASGSGKSTILRLLTTKMSILRNTIKWSGSFPKINDNNIESLSINFNYSLALIDQLRISKDISESIALLNFVGLTEAYLYIKKPDQISEGQKYRFAIAKLCDSEKPIWIADEFASTLNPEMSAIVSKGLRKLSYKYGATLILAAPHVNYFIDSLLPNKIIRLSWGTATKIYSLKILDFSLNYERLSLSIINNGLFPVTNLKIGLVKLNGAFRVKEYFKTLYPNEVINVKLKILINEEFQAVQLITSEGVGDILYKADN